MHHILELAARTFDVPILVLVGHSRRSRHCAARFAVMYALREQAYSLCEIGEALDGRDHTTILYGVEKAARLAQASPWYAARLAELCEVQG